MNHALLATAAASARRAHRRHAIVQTFLLVLSLLAVFLISRPVGDPLVRWGYVVGLASQPFWILTAWQSRPRPWGMLVLSLFYLAIWIEGISRRF